MKCVTILLLSIIRCHCTNETISATTTTIRNTSDKDDGTDSANSSPMTASNHQHYFLPLQMNILLNESTFTVHEDYPQQTQPQPQQAPLTAQKTTLSRIVETKYGKVQGLAVTLFPSSEQSTPGFNTNRNVHPLQNKVVEVFLSVPYASPPIKSNRFSPTQTPAPWDGVRQVIKPGFCCPQVMLDIRDEAAALKEMPRGYLNYLKRIEPYLRNQSEDCLYLNIFSPAPSAAGGILHNSKKPVLVFIHGGKFSWGSGNLYDGTLFAAYASTLFVTLNYRLGVLGFLNINSSPSAKPQVANFGIVDQIAALHWIKENIAQFGGDPGNVTLMGYEAGAASIHFLLSSPAVVPGLFNRAILIAGSSKAPWALTDDPFTVANSLADSLNCTIKPNNATNFNTTTSFNSYSGAGLYLLKLEKETAILDKSTGSLIADSLLDCFKNKHFSYFTKFLPPKFAVDFGPSVDGVVILPNFWTTAETQPEKRDLTKKYDLLFGLSSAEMLYELGENDMTLGVEPPRRDAILRTLVRNSYGYHLNEILATISNEYVDWERNIQHPISARDFTISAVTDCLSLAPLIAASESSQIRRSYFYVFDHSTKNGLYSSFQKTGGSNGEELNYFFGMPLVESILPFFPPLLPSNYTKSEMGLSEMLITFISNFAHSGDPNEPNKGDTVWPISKEKNKYKTVEWEQYDRVHQKYLELTANRIRIRSHYRAHQMAVWLRLVPELERNGAQYASLLHNQMAGGYDSALYVGRLRLPEELAIARHHSGGNLVEDMYLNGSGIHPSPPSTCFSSLSSISSEMGRVNSGATVVVEERKPKNESVLLNPQIMSPYTSALSITIAIGCSLLIMNVFVFAILFYRRDKKRAAEAAASTDQSLGGNSTTGTQSQLSNFLDTPELLQSNSTIATFHQAQPQSINMYTFDGNDQYHQDRFKHSKNVNFLPAEVASGSLERGGSRMSSQLVSDFPVVPEHGNDNMLPPQHHRNPHVHFSYTHSPKEKATNPSRQSISAKPQELQTHTLYHTQDVRMQQKQELQTPHISVNLDPSTHRQQPLEVCNLSEQYIQNPNKELPPSTGAAIPNSNAVVTSIMKPASKKPVPPARSSASSYTITQRQIFSVIITLLTFGIV